MEIINLDNYYETRSGTAIALGNFDGIHLGHQELIKKMTDKGRMSGLKTSLLLFKNHTKVITSNVKPYMITNNEQKIRIAEKLNIDIVYFLDFNEKIMKLSPESFIKDIIIKQMNGKLLVAGFDYRFGHKASGDSKLLKELGNKYGIHVTILNPVQDNKKIISSSLIRKLISDGSVVEASKLLGRRYSIIGNVITGSNRGNKLGFPTANIKPIDNYVIPKTGVYATNTIIRGKKYLSATNIGYNPTFNENSLKIETYILDFKEDIYGEVLEVEFIDFIRDDIKFDNIDDLINQMNKDVELIKSNY